MENKYYKPSKEEFYIGFECEKIVQHTDGGHQIDLTNIDQKSFIIKDVYDIPNDEASLSWFRVKYLDKEDIESLGFIITQEEIKSYGHYITASIKHDSYVTTTMIYSFVKNKDYVYVHLSNSHFNGNGHYYLKNKSELRKLMQQLKIIKDET